MGQQPSTPERSRPSERPRSQLTTDSDTTCVGGPQIPFNQPDEQQTPWSDNADQLGWNDCTFALNKQEAQDDPFPPNPFVYHTGPTNFAKCRNVILFGETGVGKSSVINLMAGAEVAETSSRLDGCTLHATEYTFTLPGETPLCIYDTVGLNEPDIGVNTFFGAIEKANKLVRSLHDAGGVDLLLFCVRGGRITATTQRNYRLFYEFLCEKKVPLSFVVTHLEYELGAMEDWWEGNKEAFKHYGMESVAHACTTAIPARVESLAPRRAESLTALQKMLHESFSSASKPYVKDRRNWFASFVERLWSIVKRNLPEFLGGDGLSKKLQTRCGLSPEEAQQLADMLAASR